MRGAAVNDELWHRYSLASGRKAWDLPCRQSRRAARKSAWAAAFKSKPSASAISQNCFHGMMAACGAPRSSTTICFRILITAANYPFHPKPPTKLISKNSPVSAGAAPGENFLRCTNCYSGSTRPGRKEFYFSAWNQGIAPIEWRLAPPLLNGARRRSARMFKGGAP